MSWLEDNYDDNLHEDYVNNKEEPKECPICGCSFFTGNCRECGYNVTE